MLDLATFRLWDIPGSVEPATEEVQVTLRQAGTGLRLALTLVHHQGEGWRLIARPSGHSTRPSRRWSWPEAKST